MPKKEKSENSSKPKDYKITITGAPQGTSFTVYLNDNPRRYTQGTLKGEELILNVPSELGGKGNVTFTPPRVDRLLFRKTYSVNFDLDKDVVIDVEEEIAKYSSPEAPPTTTSSAKSDKKIMANTLKKEVEEAKKETSEEIPAATSVQAPLRGPGGKFISKKEKKLIQNKLQEEVQKAKEESSIPLDGQAGDNNNESGEDEKPKDSFWDKFK
jgi:hypothetical protein